MTKKILFILLFQVLAFSGYSQDTIAEPEQSNRISEITPFAVVDPPPCDGCPLGYQWNRDYDKDGFGNPEQVLYSQTKPNGYVANQQDCNDNDITINPNTIWYRDADGDGYGVSTPRLVQCLQPTGYVRNASDLNDNNSAIINVPPQTYYRDADGDSFGNPAASISSSSKPAGYVADQQDCNDADFNINPNTIWYRDLDGDTYGLSSIYVASCTQPSGYVRNSADYDDVSAYITNIAPQFFYRDADGDGWGSDPSAYRSVKPDGYVTNKQDYDDTTRNINNIAPQTFYQDADLDGFGNPAVSVYYSIRPYTWVTNNTDCNDGDETINPNTFWYADADGDGYGNYNIGTRTCMRIGYVRNDIDCNDADASLNPNTVWYRDADADGYGNIALTAMGCAQPTGYVRNDLDCNDSNAGITTSLVWYRDQDADGYGNSGLTTTSCSQPSGYVSNNVDCNDADASINPNTVWYRDVDTDGYGNSGIVISSCTQPAGYVRNSADYNDTTANITNIAPQIFYQDVDEDTFGNPNITVFYSVKPIGFVTNNSDCNDTDATLNPNTKWYVDNDSDGLGDPSDFVQQCLIPNGKYVRNNSDNCPLIAGTSSDCSNVVAPSDYNYVITKMYKQPISSIIETPTVDQAQTNITYFDGLGRPMQQISSRQSSSGTDIITHIGYDDFGRQVQEYLPFKSQGSALAYEENAKDNTVNFYNNEKYENTSNPFSQKQLEASPLNRIIKQAAPGTSWAMGSGHEIKLDYLTNTADEVKLYQAMTTWDAGSGLYETAFSYQGQYAEKQLYKNVTYDENSTVGSNSGTEEFKNKEGQVVLKRTYEAGAKHDTYYVYDTYGNLTYMIPPKADGAITDDVLNGLCYQYKYDYRNRLAEKKLPGKQWEFIVYDKLDRPVATGPALSPFKDDATKGWLITKYDAFSRPIYTGWSSQTVSSPARKTLQDAQNSAATLFERKQSSGTIDGIAVNYTNTIAPTSFKLLTVNYYDDYTYPNAPVVPGNIEGDPVLSNVKGLGTGSWTRVATMASAMLHETSTTFYDVKSRPIRTYSQNHLGGYTVTDSKLDFTGKPLYTISKHKRTAGDLELTIKEEFTYSPQDRLLTHTHQINGGVTQLLASNTYNDLGQLISKNVGNNTGSPLQKVDYKYNIRGWLTGINETDDLQQNTDPVDLFAFKINYDKTQTDIQNVKALYNGNIAETFWKTASDDLERSYGYKYDNLNRLTNAVYQKSKLTTEAYNENLAYDKNGNIMFLNRNGDMDPQIGTNSIDNLVYTYPSNSNQLFKVVDNSNNSSGFNDANTTGDDYAYDDNGNLISDKNKNITSILYNQLNLPKKIIFGTGNTIEYIYNSVGQKLEKIVTENNVAKNTNYLGGFQYKDNVLEFFPTAEGYVKNENGALSYVFQYKDHLGNVRLSYARNPATQVLEIIEENNYYPFGLKHKGYNDYVATNNKYKYNGKELQDELGLNFYDYGARNYDPAIGRWMNIDPLAEKSRRFSPYTYALDNPVYFIDPDGMMAGPPPPPDWFVNRETGAVVQVEGKSKLTQETADKIGAGDAKKYDRLGADNMFGDKNEKANNIREMGASRVENPENFMEDQGYKMADKVRMKELDITSKGSFGEENIPLNDNTPTKLSEVSVTYVKPDELNKKTNLSSETSTGPFSSITTSKYTLTTPHANKESSSSSTISSMITDTLKVLSGILTDHIDHKYR